MNADPTDERACRVSLAVFDGPLDLLLTLIKEHELDIMTVPLATVAEQYFAYIRIMEAIDVELAAEYLVVAATLVFLKSKALLPPLPAEFESGEESAEAIEERLRERLIVYSRYRAAGDDLRSRLALAAAFYLREGGDPTSELVQRYRIPADRLAAALLAALRSTKSEKRHIAARARLAARADGQGHARGARQRPGVLFRPVPRGGQTGRHRDLPRGARTDPARTAALRAGGRLRRHRSVADGRNGVACSLR